VKLTNKQLKQIIKEELSYVLNEMSGGLDALKSNMDMFEYNMIRSNVNNPDKLVGYLMELKDSNSPNRFYTEAGFPGVYWEMLANGAAIQGISISHDVIRTKEAVIESSSLFTPTGLGRAIAILEYLEAQG